MPPRTEGPKRTRRTPAAPLDLKSKSREPLLAVANGRRIDVARSAAKKVARAAKKPATPSPAEGKLSTRIANEIEAEVIRAGWPVGRYLGSEAELLERFNVSRATLREAIRQLEAHGAATTKRGAGGGLVVGEEPMQAAERAIAIYLELIDASAEELFEARTVLEPFAARLAAERGDDKAIERLQRQLKMLTASRGMSMTQIVTAHVEVRHIIGLMAGNPALSMFVGALNRFTVEAIANEISANFERAAAEEPLGFKLRIADAIIAHNSYAAEQAMHDDVQNRRKVLAEHFKTHAQREASDVRALVGEDSPLLPKRAQLLAVALAHDIGRRALKPGDKLGSEADLLVRFGVSRAIFREAMRILELHGFVRTRRGHGGGLHVASPDPAYAISAAENYLRYAKMDRRHFPEVRGRLAVYAAQLAAERLDPEGKAELKRALDDVLSADAEGMVRASSEFHALIGALSRNRALALFIQVLLHLNRRPRSIVLPDQIIAKLRVNSQRIHDSIVSGDPNMSRRRMVEHMQDVQEWAAKGLTVFK